MILPEITNTRLYIQQEMYSVYTIKPDVNWIFCYSNILHSNGRIQSVYFCVYIAINFLKCEEYIIILVITVIVSQLVVTKSLEHKFGIILILQS